MKTCEAPIKRISRQRGTCVASNVSYHKGKAWLKRNTSMQNSLLFSLRRTASTLVHDFLNQPVTYANGLSNVLAMTTNVNVKLTSSKLERQGARVAALIRHDYPQTQSFLCLQVPAERVLALQSNHSKEKPGIHSGAGGGVGGGHHRKLLKKVPFR